MIPLKKIVRDNVRTGTYVQNENNEMKTFGTVTYGTGIKINRSKE